MKVHKPFTDVVCEPETGEAMTLQVGLIGASGFVIASDRLVQKQQYLNLKTPMHSSRTKKIQVFLKPSGERRTNGFRRTLPATSRVNPKLLLDMLGMRCSGTFLVFSTRPL